MKPALLGLFFSIFLAAPVCAETWIAICNDQQRLQYNQTRGDEGSLILLNANKTGGTIVARLKQTYVSNNFICGTTIGSREGHDGYPVTQICANRRQQTIFIRYKHPYENRPIESRTFCNADVTLRD